MSTSTASLRERADLAQLVEVITAEHAHAQLFVTKALEHAISCGEALEEAHSILGPRWAKWIRSTLLIGESTARMYVRLARYRDELAEAGIRTIENARRHVIENRLVIHAGPTLPEGIEISVAALAEKGLTTREIGAMVGASRTTVSSILRGERKSNRPGRPKRSPITTEQIERLSEWLVGRFGGFDYPERITPQVRTDAEAALAAIYGVSRQAAAA